MGREYAYGCEHDFDEAPEPSVLTFRNIQGELVWEAYTDDSTISAVYPTREGAIAAWKAEWTRERDRARLTAAKIDGALYAVGAAVLFDGRRYTVDYSPAFGYSIAAADPAWSDEDVARIEAAFKKPG